MIPFQRVLVPVDYSAPCESVLPYVRHMAREFDAQIALVHARCDVETDSGAEDCLREFGLQRFPGMHLEYHASSGEPGTVIRNVVRRQGTDLVMMATHGHGPIRRLLLGSVTAKLLHDLDTPIWTGASAALASVRPPHLPYRSILCAISDGAETSGVLRAAQALACRFRARLRILHVIETPPVGIDVDFNVYQQAAIEGHEERLREHKCELALDATHAVVDGMVADCVRREALSWEADLIVAGRGHAQAPLGPFWSHLYSIVRESPCPVISV